MVVRLVLFDIDGTLLVSSGAGRRAMDYAGRQVLGAGFSIDEIDFAGGLDPWIFREAARRSGFLNADDQHDRFRDAYLKRLPEELACSDRAPIALPGVLELLELLRARGDVTLGLVTGNYAEAAPMKLQAAGIWPEQFEVGAFGDHAATRPELVRRAMGDWARRGVPADPARVVVVGDTPRDIDCALQNNCRCLAVATGTYDFESLEGLGADHVAADLVDPAPLLKLLEEM